MKNVNLFLFLVLSFSLSFLSCTKENLRQETINIIDHKKKIIYTPEYPLNIIQSKKDLLESELYQLALDRRQKNKSDFERTQLLETYYHLSNHDLNQLHKFTVQLNKEDLLKKGDVDARFLEIKFQEIEKLNQKIEDTMMKKFQKSPYRHLEEMEQLVVDSIWSIWMKEQDELSLGDTQ